MHSGNSTFNKITPKMIRILVLGNNSLTPLKTQQTV
jgi:hypothetical protein